MKVSTKIVTWHFCQPPSSHGIFSDTLAIPPPPKVSHIIWGDPYLNVPLLNEVLASMNFNWTYWNLLGGGFESTWQTTRASSLRPTPMPWPCRPQTGASEEKKICSQFFFLRCFCTQSNTSKKSSLITRVKQLSNFNAILRNFR